MPRRQIDSQELARNIHSLLICDADPDSNASQSDLADQFLAKVRIDPLTTRGDYAVLRVNIADGDYSLGGTWDLMVKPTNRRAMTVPTRRALVEAEIAQMFNSVETALNDLDMKLADLRAFTVTTSALAQDAYDLAGEAAELSQRVTSKLRLLSGKYSELKREIPAAFRVPAFRTDVIDALRDAGIDVEIMER